MDTTKNLHRFTPDGLPVMIAWFDEFDGINPYAALSNFYIGAPISIPGLGSAQTYMTGEHAYAAMKCWGVKSNKNYDRIVAAPDPQSAKTLGRTLPMRPDWEEVKYDVMLAVLRAKFTLTREEGKMLLNTGDALLIEGTYWEDEVWGVDLIVDSPLHAPGRNWLGTMLMARRAELKAEKMFNNLTIDTGAYNASFATA